MEPFIDGGIFEVIIAIAFGYAINFIFLKKYLLLFFSVLSVAAPVLLIFSPKGELYYMLFGLCLFNSLFLVILLWKERIKNPHHPLFDIEKFRRKIFRKNSISKIAKN